MEKISPLTRLWRLVRSERAEIKNIYVFAIFQGLVNLSLPLGIQAIINLLQAGQLRTSWAVLVTFVLLGILLYGILQIRLMQLTESIEQRVFTKSAFDFAYRIPRISASALRGKYFPEIMNRFFEVSTIQKSFSKLLIELSSSAVQILFGLLLLSFYHPLFILLGFILISLLGMILWLTGASGLKSSLEESTHKFAVAHWLEEVARTLKTFKLAGKTELPLDKTDFHTSQYLDARKKHFNVLVAQYKILIAFKLILAATLIIAGSLLVVDGQINIGQFVAAEIVILLVINSVERLILNMSTTYDLLTALEKVGSITDLPLERESGAEPMTLHKPYGMSLRIHDLYFRYADAESDVLHNINFEIQPGEKVCLTGAVGSGKSTLLKIITGYLDGYRGSIVVNEIPLSNINLNSYRLAVGENFNDQDIFRGSIIDNILCGRPGITVHDAAHISKVLGLHSFVENLKDGYETYLDPDGVRLSSGIMRKIVLARCLVNKPRLLLMEDNLSVFPLAERTILLENIFKTFPDMTALIISNDDAVMRFCYREIRL